MRPSPRPRRRGDLTVKNAGPLAWSVAALVRPGIDSAWLEGLFRDRPADHALAVWDRTVWPEAVDFLSLVEDGRPTAYLLIWKGLPGCPVLHWLGEAGDPEPLLKEFPPRPFLAIVPPELAERVAEHGAPSRAYPLHLRERPPTPVAPNGDRPTRRLGAGDVPALHDLASSDPSTVTDTYLAVQPERDWIVGGFHGSELVAVARAEVRLPRIWHISGVYTRPAYRQNGWGRAVVAHLIREAADSGAGTALFVRDDNLPARGVYDRLGYASGGPRVWVDAGAERTP